MLLSDKMGVEVKKATDREPNPEIEKLRNEIRESMNTSREGPSMTEPEPPTNKPTK
jgi:hypothetical protein